MMYSLLFYLFILSIILFIYLFYLLLYLFIIYSNQLWLATDYSVGRGD